VYGNGRLLCDCLGDGKVRLGRIRGKIKRMVVHFFLSIVLDILWRYCDGNRSYIIKRLPG
jgi:hypothetical protein